MFAVTSFEANNSVFSRTDENISFSISTPSHWSPEDGERLINKLNIFLELRSGNYIELHVKEVELRGSRKEMEDSGYSLSGFDHYKSEIFAE